MSNRLSFTLIRIKLLGGKIVRTHVLLLDKINAIFIVNYAQVGKYTNKLFIYVYGHSAGMYVCAPCVPGVLRGQKAADPPGTGVTNSCELPRGHWELIKPWSSGRPASDLVEPSLQPPHKIFILDDGRMIRALA